MKDILSSKPIKVIVLVLLMLLGVYGVNRVSIELERESIEKRRTKELVNEKNAINIAKKVVNIYQLGEKGRYEEAKRGIYSYLSDEMKETYFPKGDRVPSVLEPSVIRLGGIGVREEDKGYEVVIDFEQQRGNVIDKHKVRVGVERGIIYKISPIY